MSSQPDDQTKTQRASRRQPRRRPHVAGQTIESYLRANSAPRYMVRLRDIEAEYRSQRRRLQAAYEDLLAAAGDDLALFAERWRRQAERWRFDRLNDLVRAHNAWYPIEANLPMDPRTGDYRPIRGASYRRIELGAEFVLEHFKPTPDGADPAPPPHTPREPSRTAKAGRRPAKVTS